MSIRPQTLFGVALGIGLFGLTLVGTADNSPKATNTKVAFAPNERATTGTRNPADGLAERDSYIFSASTNAGYAESVAMYQPIADYLTRATGKRFVYRHSANWLSYSKDLANNTYDLVFDGPVTNGWRQDRMNHTPLVKLSTDLAFVTIARKDNAKVTMSKHLVGQKVCAHAPTDPEVVALMSQFDNPARQPVIVETKGWDASFQGVIDGKCAATVVPRNYLERQERGMINVLHKHQPMPSFAFSAGPRLSPQLQSKIRDALLSDDSKQATAKLRGAFGDDNFVAATSAEYANLGKLLRGNLYLY